MPSDSATYVYLKDGYQIVYDRDNWMLMKTVLATRESDGEEYERDITLGYYSDPAPAARAYLMEYLKNAGDKSIPDFIAAIERAQKTVTEAISKASGWPTSPATRRRN